MGDDMSEGQKNMKNAPLMLGAVVLSLVTLFGFVQGIPFAMKSDVEKQIRELKEVDKELKETDKTLWELKNQDNKWYQEVAQEVAVVGTKVENLEKGVETRMRGVEKKLDSIETLLRDRR